MLNDQGVNVLFSALDVTEFNRVKSLTNANDIWKKLMEIHEGTLSVKEAKLYLLKGNFSEFTMKEHEPEVLVTSGPDLPAAVEAGTAAVASAGTAEEAGTAAGTAGTLIPLCNTRFIKEHKPSNHIRARIRSHVYT